MHLLHPQEGDVVCDATLGLGGHARAFLNYIGTSGRLIGLDADELNVKQARANLKNFENQTDLRHANFRDLSLLDLPPLDILLADLGLSSPHLDDPARGFTFREEGPLDLRFDQLQGEPASAWLVSVDANVLAQMLRDNNVPRAWPLAQRLRVEQPATTTELRTCVEADLGWRTQHNLPKIFQTLRIAVNDELGALKKLLEAGVERLKPKGRFAVISYHSLEDRMVKHFFRTCSTGEKDDYTGAERSKPPFQRVTRHAVVPSAEEVERNPRSRSAKLRVLQKV